MSDNISMSTVSPTSDQLNLNGLLSPALAQPYLQELAGALAAGDPPPPSSGCHRTGPQFRGGGAGAVAGPTDFGAHSPAGNGPAAL